MSWHCAMMAGWQNRIMAARMQGPAIFGSASNSPDATPSATQRQAGLGAVEGLDLALLVDREHHRMGGRIDIEADDVAQLRTNSGSLESLKRRTRCG